MHHRYLCLECTLQDFTIDWEIMDLDVELRLTAFLEFLPPLLNHEKKDTRNDRPHDENFQNGTGSCQSAWADDIAVCPPYDYFENKFTLASGA